MAFRQSGKKRPDIGNRPTESIWRSERLRQVAIRRVAPVVTIVALFGAGFGYGVYRDMHRAAAPTTTTTGNPTNSTLPELQRGPLRPPVTASPGVPAQLLDLTNWEVTLPILDSETGAALEIKQPQLATYTNANYFSLTSDGKGVRFRANAGGATTSGSQYPRSELREMANGGYDKASWSTSQGVHTMHLRESINHLPDVKPQLVFAQIHDTNDDVIEAEIARVSGANRLYINHNGTQYGTNLDTNYALGTPFDLDITASKGYIDVAYNGVVHVHQMIQSSGDYFKAGCYTQSNTIRGDSTSAYGEVVMYDLQVTHS